MQKTNKIYNMGPIGESDYGFYCDIEEEYQKYPRQNIKSNKLNTILEETYHSSSSIKLKYDNFKNEIININIKSIVIYILVSLGSMCVTTKLFYKYYS